MVAREPFIFLDSNNLKNFLPYSFNGYKATFILESQSVISNIIQVKGKSINILLLELVGKCRIDKLSFRYRYLALLASRKILDFPGAELDRLGGTHQNFLYP